MRLLDGSAFMLQRPLHHDGGSRTVGLRQSGSTMFTRAAITTPTIALSTSMPAPAGVDLLTRTTLQIDRILSAPLIAQLTLALQHVPGVLLADVDAVSARASIAHDSGVPTASLLAAAAGAGAFAHVVADAPAPDSLGCAPARPRYLRDRRLLTIAAALFVALAVIDALIPALAARDGLLVALSLAFWVFFLARSIAAPR